MPDDNSERQISAEDKLDCLRAIHNVGPLLRAYAEYIRREAGAVFGEDSARELMKDFCADIVNNGWALLAQENGLSNSAETIKTSLRIALGMLEKFRFSYADLEKKTGWSERKLREVLKGRDDDLAVLTAIMKVCLTEPWPPSLKN